VMAEASAQVVVKAGPFGEGSGGHSHSDALSLTARLGNREILIDPGTFTYIADPAERNRFRGSSAHNTVRIDERDQAIPAGPFRWDGKPEVRVDQWAAAAKTDFLDASCSYGGFTHRRRILFLKPSRVVILDHVDGLAGEHLVEQFWHLASPEDAARLSFSAPPTVIGTWRSRALCSREPATALSLLQRIRKRFKIKPKTIGADKGYDQGPFLSELEKRKITPHVAVKDGPIGGAPGTRHRKVNAQSIEARTRMRRRMRSQGYGISQRCRKKIEELFGWAKTIAGLARTRLIGHCKTNQQAHIAASAFNLVRMRNLAA